MSGNIAATVLSTEFTGADLLVHTQIGNQTLTVRADGKAVIQTNTQVNLGWHDSNLHWFDAEGLRIH
jgi:sn-glycerol 3-phosphate transport system ATP-binding protein